MFLKSSFYGLALILLCGLGLGAGSVAAQTPRPERQTPRMPALHFPAGKNVVEVPFEIQNSWMVIPVSVNGSRPLRFVVDSGSAGAAITNPAIVDSLNLKITGNVQTGGAGGGGATFEVSVADHVNFDIAGLELSNGNLVISPFRGAGSDGVIGRSLFASLVVEIDWEQQVIRFYEPGKYKYSGAGTVLPLTFDEAGRPYTMASVTTGEKTIPVKLVVDTGGSHSLMLEAGANSPIEIPAGATKTVLGRGVSGEITGYRGQIGTFELGGQKLKDVPTIFPDSSSGTAGVNGRQGNLGSGILRRFKVIYDYSRKQMIIEPNKFFSEPFVVAPRSVASADVAPATMQEYIGRYGERIISFEDHALYLQRQGGPKLKLVVGAKDEFTLEGIPEARIRFIRGADGKVTELNVLNRAGEWEKSRRELP